MKNEYTPITLVIYQYNERFVPTCLGLLYEFSISIYPKLNPYPCLLQYDLVSFTSRLYDLRERIFFVISYAFKPVTVFANKYAMSAGTELSKGRMKHYCKHFNTLSGFCYFHNSRSSNCGPKLRNSLNTNYCYSISAMHLITYRSNWYIWGAALN